MNGYFHSKNILASISLLVLFAFGSVTKAEIYKCEVDGKTAFQSDPCSQGTQSVIQAPEESIGDLHSSWFTTPSMQPERLECTGNSCFCGGKLFQAKDDLFAALISSMKKIQDRWVRYNEDIKDYIERMQYRSHNRDNRYRSRLKSRLEKNACEIAFHQKIIKDHYVDMEKEISLVYEALQKDLEPLDVVCPRPSKNEWDKAKRVEAWMECKKDNKRYTKRNSHNHASLHSSLNTQTLILQRPK